MFGDYSKRNGPHGGTCAFSPDKNKNNFNFDKIKTQLSLFLVSRYIMIWPMMTWIHKQLEIYNFIWRFSNLLFSFMSWRTVWHCMWHNSPDGACSMWWSSSQSANRSRRTHTGKGESLDTNVFVSVPSYFLNLFHIYILQRISHQYNVHV